MTVRTSDGQSQQMTVAPALLKAIAALPARRAADWRPRLGHPEAYEQFELDQLTREALGIGRAYECLQPEISKADFCQAKGQDLLARLDLSFFNRFDQLRDPRRETWLHLLHRLSLLPVPLGFRAMMWLLMIGHRPDADDLDPEGARALRMPAGSAEQREAVDAWLAKCVQAERGPQPQVMPDQAGQEELRRADPAALSGPAVEGRDRAQNAAVEPKDGPTAADVPAAVRTWLLRLCGPSDVREAELQTLRERVSALTKPPSTIEELLKYRQGISEAAEALSALAAATLEPAAAAKKVSEALQVYAELRSSVEGAIDFLFEALPDVAPNDLREARALVDAGVLGIRRALGDTPTEGLIALARGEERARTVELVTALDGMPGDVLRLLEGVPKGPDDRISTEVAMGLVQELASLPTVVRAWVVDACIRREDPVAVHRALKCATELLQLAPKTLCDDICVELASADMVDDFTEMTRAFSDGLHRAQIELGSCSRLSIHELKHIVGRLAGSVPPAQTPTYTYIATLDHDRVDSTGARAPISFIQASGEPFGWVALPLKVSVQQPQSLNARLDVRVTSGQRDGWPSSWPNATPERVAISGDDWLTGPNGVEAPITLNLPVRLGKGTEGLTVRVTLQSEDGPRQLSKESELRWDSVESSPDPIEVIWPDRLNPAFVTQHPIGPQKKHGALAGRVKSGSSFAVVAPRRFGKSTLVEYLREHAAEWGAVCPAPIVCTEFTAGGSADLPAIWRAVSARLQAELGSGLELSGQDPLPGEKAFVHVREAAARRGCGTVLLLVDEAQLFFPKIGGAALGDRLKDRLERHWSAGPGPGVAIGFVGLQGLRRRGGANLMGLLRVEEASSMQEQDLNALLLGVTAKRLHTTKQARQRLVGTASNLFMVRTLLERLVEHVNRSGRTWASVADVREVEAELINELERGEAGAVSDFVRDALNDADSVNDWRPSPGFPVAAAVSLARRSGEVSTEGITARAVDVLKSWCGQTSGAHNGVFYSTPRCKELLQALSESGVLVDGLRFRSRFLEAWLVGQIRDGLPLDARNALLRGALPQVRVPEGLEPLAEGGQAELFRFEQGGVPFVLRKVKLTSDADRDRFLESVLILNRLGEISKTEEGAAYIFDLKEAGFSEQGEGEGIQVYRFVNGEDLQSKTAELPPALVAKIGLCLAKALRVLADHDIIHRDVCPRNIILSHPEKRPVLIDFGLARLGSAAQRTSLTGEHVAPEVRTEPPAWSPAADVYALGATLRSLLHRDAGCQPLLDVLGLATAKRPADRPSAAQLVAMLERVSARLAVDDERARVEATIMEIVGADIDKPWYIGVVHKFMTAFEVVALGYHRHQIDQCAEVADFLNQVLEAAPTMVGREPLSLGYVKRDNSGTGSALALPSVDVLHKLRVYLSHAERRNQRQVVLQKLGGPTPERLHGHVLEGAASIGAFLRIASIERIVKTVLDAGGRQVSAQWR